MKREVKRETFVRDAINKMLEIAGHDFTYEQAVADTNKESPWYSRHTWTADQEAEWNEWFLKEIVKRRICNKKQALIELGWFSLMWGLRTVEKSKL